MVVGVEFGYDDDTDDDDGIGDNDDVEVGKFSVRFFLCRRSAKAHPVRWEPKVAFGSLTLA